jgi:hypothetical protein
MRAESVAKKELQAFNINIHILFIKFCYNYTVFQINSFFIDRVICRAISNFSNHQTCNVKKLRMNTHIRFTFTDTTKARCHRNPLFQIGTIIVPSYPSFLPI